MKSRPHLYAVGGMYLALGLWALAGGIVLAASSWPDWNGMKHGNASIAHIFQIVLFLTGVIMGLSSALLFSTAAAFWRSARTGVTIPSLAPVTVAMVIFFPIGTVLGAYAWFARKHHLREMPGRSPPGLSDGRGQVGTGRPWPVETGIRRTDK